MTTENPTTVAAVAGALASVSVPTGARRTSLIARIAERYSMDPTKLMGTLKATAFKSEKPVTDEQMAALLVVADQYRLNPFTKELFAFPDKQGGIVPFVSLDGWVRIINEHPMFDGMAFEFEPDGSACTCTMYRKDRAHPVVITEFLKECKRGTAPWSSHPLRMLRHKALIQAARIAFGFAGIYDQDEAERIINPDDAPAPSQRPEPASATATRMRQRMRAEAIDVPAVEVPEPPPEAPPTDSRSLAAWALSLRDAPTEDAAAMVLDEARGLPADQYEALCTQFRQRFPAE